MRNGQLIVLARLEAPVVLIYPPENQWEIMQNSLIILFIIHEIKHLISVA